jgi:hypothetical protein
MEIDDAEQLGRLTAEVLAIEEILNKIGSAQRGLRATG